MKILFVSDTCSRDKYDSIDKQRTVRLLGAQQKLFDLVIKGLASNGRIEVECLTAVPVSASSHPRRLWREEKEGIAGNLLYHYIGFLNGKYLRFITCCLSVAKACRKWLNKHAHEPSKVVICDPLLAHCATAAARTARRNGCKVVAFVTDIPRYISAIGISSHGRIRQILQRAYNRFSTREMLRYDAYILLTESMNDIINPEGKPYIIMEGCADIGMMNARNRLEDKDVPRTIVYAGGIHEKFGVEKLARAFSKSNLHDIRLHIYGAGEHIGVIEAIAGKDRRIEYMGILPAEEIVKREAAAVLLVNPRPAGEEFTKYSFPSKTTEYMATGTPVLSTRLPGIPEEYSDYILWFDGETEDEMKARLEEVARMDSRELHAFGKRTKDFAMREKNNVEQAGRILVFIGELLTGND